MVDISEAEGQRGFAHVGEHVAEEGFMLLLTRTEPRLCDQIAERLSGAERVASTIEQRADLLLNHLQRDVIADQVMPDEQRQQAPGAGLPSDGEPKQRSLSQ
ncbi:hypothetical protein BGLT_06275 [Caballeronia glathei]|nr:hypothetical protein BGLT_06275 [Caballeronia glathei]